MHDGCGGTGAQLVWGVWASVRQGWNWWGPLPGACSGWRLAVLEHLHVRVGHAAGGYNDELHFFPPRPMPSRFESKLQSIGAPQRVVLQNHPSEESVRSLISPSAFVPYNASL